MNPRIEVRNIPSPLGWERARPIQPQLVWHHIIPFSVLRDVWNSLVDQQVSTELAEARVAIRQYLLLLNRHQPRVDELIDRIRAENTDQERAGHHRLLPLRDHEADDLRRAAVWPAWNTVEGPQQRSDDPGDWYIDRFTAGLPALEAARMRAIEILFGQLQAFIRAAPGSAGLRALAQAASRARTGVSCDEPIRFRPQMWVFDEDTSRWHKARDRGRKAPAA